MIRSIDANTDAYLNRLRDINQRIDKLQAQLASGKRLSQPSDDSVRVTNLMQVQSAGARMTQIQSNLQRFTTESGAAEGALQNALTLMDRVRSLGMTGANSTSDISTRQGIADELGSILQRMVGLANSQSDGRYLFAGDTDQTQPFTVDMTQAPPYSAYQGTASTREAMHPTGVIFPISMQGGEIFENADPSKNVFLAIDGLRQALLSNDDAAIQAALTPLDSAFQNLNSAATFYGNVQSQLMEATDTASRLQLQLSTEKANIEDADAGAVLVELQSLKFNQQAALEMKSKMPRTSLFDYLG